MKSVALIIFIFLNLFIYLYKSQKQFSEEKEIKFTSD